MPPVPPRPRQGSLDELGRPLRDVTFVVFDLETTGTGPSTAEITEFGAVKVHGGEVVAEFATLVRTTDGVPPLITVLTGITDAMLAEAPPLAEVLPAFLEFIRGSVLVAHNAGFDLSFLKAACERVGYPVPTWEHLDTAKLARRVVTRDESPDNKLSSLARLFRARTEPCHRALADARATVDVLHGLFERLGNLGVTTLEDVHEYSARVSPAQRRKRTLADDLPTGPGVYLFRDGSGRVLYVGKSASVRTRVRTYFTASETRTRMAEMVAAAERVDAISCAHALEAEVRELRLIAEHKPPYNRRSRFPERVVFLRLTDEPFPRLSMVRAVRADGATYLGPFRDVNGAELAAEALLEAVALRRCGGRLSPRRPSPACALADLGKCGAPCDGRQSVDEYAVLVAAAREAITGAPDIVVAAAHRRMRSLAEQERYEEAALTRDRMAGFVRAAARQQRLAALGAIAELVGAVPTAERGWDLAVVRHGRLAAAATVARGVDPRPWVDAVVATAETVRPGPGPTPAASAAEMERIERWLSSPGARLVQLTGTWAWPAAGSARAAAELPAPPPADPRTSHRTTHQPGEPRRPLHR
ncbi:DEDD exonuclease domain-containing protein [Frankia sp. CNm7]|uniref:DEDD exonuclease domain-containing protein n=1 Tax=Frankia nepalensis TaxID=1836974 RepID=A0A937RVF9_9ACTN|nr:DEDD exonuclease domain-containing protein [Frankia nepalensis]MBL7500659.1 DEDD exonuclease domain-containing protein [Frankia nepalensis]MBL7515123.1 DEDD exonuclease domain-containing protein [Frankia nepalensis]MBL7522592.1 DEDD exonuclease domain-containing protein [Frankia nepalensis]MBL7632606.1 DEDD exonuclease domain-containing protein [Frankia nepalensis]